MKVREKSNYMYIGVDLKEAYLESQVTGAIFANLAKEKHGFVTFVTFQVC